MPSNTLDLVGPIAVLFTVCLLACYTLIALFTSVALNVFSCVNIKGYYGHTTPKLIFVVWSFGIGGCVVFWVTGVGIN